MRIFFTLVLFTTATLAGAQTATSSNPQDALALAVRSQAVLNEYVIGAIEPEAMKYAQRLRLTQAALDGQRKQWPTVRTGPDPWDSYRACKNALEKASDVAGLSAMKAVSTLDNKVFHAEKTKLQQLRVDCTRQISSGTGGSKGSAAAQK
ncbi:MAG: hypothetical protein Q8O29_13605 [Polaromonas sp.]|uniref:hypothetical protein n=1 Tax=Polaromonas sp. TaxID=1869339 RepID=UPI0027365A63|nr:hypothetical protein [Polaromonas sp.]MDP2819275.1 hypothetical protein [Polaromonas sp.]